MPHHGQITSDQISTFILALWSSAHAATSPHGRASPNLVDFAAGPAVVRFERLAKLLGIDFYANLPRVAAWSRAIASRPAFTATLVGDFDTRFSRLVRRHGDAAA